MKFNASLVATFALFALPGAALAQFTDTFDTINSAWALNRYAPAGFASVIFDGDSRLQLTIDQSGSTANRGPTFSAPFYNTQGEQRAGGITGSWTLSAEVYVSSSFNTTTGALAESDLWGHTGTTPGGGDYAILGFTNASPSDTLNPNPAAADRTFRFEAFNVVTGGWVDLGVPAGFVFDAWHSLSEISTGSTFEYLIDDTMYLTQPTTAGNDLLSAMVQGYNFDGTGNYSYSVNWDNVTASAVPEPATSAICAAVSVLTLACWSRRRRDGGTRDAPGFRAQTCDQERIGREQRIEHLTHAEPGAERH